MKKIVCQIVVLLLMSTTAFASIDDLETAIIQQNYEKAKQISTAMLADGSVKGKEADQAKFYLALSHLRLGEYDKARDIFTELISQPLGDQLRDRSYLGLFNAYYLSEDYDQAKKVIDKLYALSPNSSFMSMIYLKMARVNLKLTNWSKAKEYLSRIVSDYPKSMEVYTAKQLLQEKQYFAVQVGAFLDRSHAERVMNELRNKGEYSYIVETKDKDGRNFYRVRVGQMTLLDDARQLKKRLANLGYPTAIYP